MACVILALFRRLSFLFPCSFRRQTRALVVLGPGAAHGCPPASATRDCGAHKHENPGRDPKSHGGGPGRNCSRGARKAFRFRSPFYRGGLGNWGALGVGSRGGAGPKMPHWPTPVVPCRPLSRPRLWAATAAVLAVMLVWVNEKAIFCSDFSRVVFDGLL